MRVLNFVLVLLALPFIIFAQDHLLITEFVVQPTAGEFVEIYNPTSNAIDLSDYYITDATYAGGNAYYYNIVTGSNAGGGDFGDFNARFPDGASIAPGEFQTLAMDGSGFKTTYSQAPTYELYDTDSSIPDMREALPGSINGQGGLTNNGEVLIMYYWDGSSNLVQDIDYVVWGDKAEAVDKTGVTINGSTYKPDTPISQQVSVSSAEPHAIGESSQRTSLDENGEVLSGGNGITGDNETSEDLAVSFQAGTPNPGSAPFVQSGDGSGTVTVSPETVNKGQTGVSLDFTVTGEGTTTLASISMVVPSDWTASQFSAAQLSGSGFSGASATLNGNELLISQASVSAASQGHIVFQGLTAPDKDVFSTFLFETATENGNLQPIASSPAVKVGLGIETTPISDIQLNTSQYLNKKVTIQGVVTLGAGITSTSWTSGYVQDNSGYGINIYQSGTVDQQLKRGNLVIITGTVDEYNDVTELTNYTMQVVSSGNALPAPLVLSTAEITEVRWEGSYVETQGVITDLYAAGGGTTISVDDGSGAGILRIWDTAGLDLAGYAVGDTIVARGVMGLYQGAAQVLVAYQEDIFKPSARITGDGAGTAVLDLQQIPTELKDASVTLSIAGSETDTVRTVEIIVPFDWNWSGQDEQVSLTGSGLSAAKKAVILNFDQYTLRLTDCMITAADSGQVTVSGFTTPASEEFSYFWVKTAVAGGTPKFIVESPKVMVGQNASFYQIRDLQINSAQFTSPVKIEGVVTVGSGILRTDRTSAYIQDGSGRGINISKGGTPDPIYQRGFLVDITGQVSEYRGTTQIAPTTAQIVDSSAVLPQAIDLTTGQANDSRWDGTLIRVTGIVTDKYSTSTPAYDYNIVVNDGSGATMLRVWGTTGINLDSIDINSSIIARGVGSVFISNNVPSYQLLPAYQDDIELNPNYQPSLAGVSLSLPPYPFVPDRGEKIEIQFNAGAVNNHATLRIFDTAGRVITTILDRDVELIQNKVSWDGRDNNLNLVPLGTYICQLEIIEPVTGKRRVKMAPVVVGTVLKK